MSKRKGKTPTDAPAPESATVEVEGGEGEAVAETIAEVVAVAATEAVTEVVAATEAVAETIAEATGAPAGEPASAPASVDDAATAAEPDATPPDATGTEHTEPASAAEAVAASVPEATGEVVAEADAPVVAEAASEASGAVEVVAEAAPDHTEAAHAEPQTDASEVDAAAGAALEVAEAEAAAGEPAASEEPAGEPPERLKSIVESLIFAADKPLSVRKLMELTGEQSSEVLQSCIEFLRADYGDRGVVLHEVAGGYQFRTNPLNAHWVQQLIAGKPVKLSRGQLETLALVAYRQPITRPEVDEIRGVDSSASIKTLLDRGLVRILGKKEEPGRPMLYGTTKEFLEFFNLRDLKELPTLREFYELNEESVKKLQELDARRAAEGLPAAAGPHAAEGDASSGVVDEAAERSESSPA